jgi:hypothetical protein
MRSAAMLSRRGAIALGTATAALPALRARAQDAPAMLVRADTIAALRATDLSAEPRRHIERARAFAQRVHGGPLITRMYEQGRDVILPTSREMLDRVTTLAFLHWLDGDARHADRAIAEIETVCAFTDWNPEHFLDTAEMSAAVGLGLDWLRGPMGPARARAVADRLAEFALRPGIAAIRTARPGEWPVTPRNWNLVCNGGLAIGAIAAAEHHPRLAAETLALTTQHARHGFSHYAPDGGWYEGVSYWRYATLYATMMASALESAFGHAFGLTESPGFDRAGDFYLHMQGPSGRFYNFGNSDDRVQPDGLGWLGMRFRNARSVATAWSGTRPCSVVFTLLSGAGTRRNPPAVSSAPNSFRPAGAAADDGLAEPPMGALFAAAAVAAHRTEWGRAEATWIASKGGAQHRNHQHMDRGSFVLEAAGTRWAIDLGRDDYALPGYFGDNRWRYYRNGTQGHNVLAFGDSDQVPFAACPAVAFAEDPALVVWDVSPAWNLPPGTYRRGLRLLPGGAVLVVDEVTSAEARAATWIMHTQAAVQVQAQRATLTQDGRELGAELIAPAGAVFATEAATRPPPENPNRGITRLVARLPASPGPRRMAVLLRLPGVSPPATLPDLSLGAWIAAAPV